jgi:hypothetical protein
VASKGQMTGMLGVYLAAAELTQKGFVVSPTLRNARGVDLPPTDQSYRKTWAIQVKTNRKAATFWLLGKDYSENVSPTHVYIFVNLKGDARPEYFCVPSKVVAKDGVTSKSKKSGSEWYVWDWRSHRRRGRRYREKWKIFGKSPQLN